MNIRIELFLELVEEFRKAFDGDLDDADLAAIQYFAAWLCESAPRRLRYQRPVQTWGDRLRQLLRWRNMTQSHLARLLGIRSQSVALMLVRRHPTEETVTKVAAALGMTVEQFWNGATRDHH